MIPKGRYRLAMILYCSGGNRQAVKLYSFKGFFDSTKRYGTSVISQRMKKDLSKFYCIL